MVKVDNPMVKVQCQEQAERFLQLRGLFVGERVVRETVSSLQRGASKYSLWNGRKYPAGRVRVPIAAKGTVSKIEKLYRNGDLEPYLNYINSLEKTNGGALKLRSDLLPEQVGDSLFKHLSDLQSEARRWRTLIQAFHERDSRFDYTLKDLYFVNYSRPITACFAAHLDKENSSLSADHDQWFEQAENFSRKVNELKRRWEEALISRLDEGKGDDSEENSWFPYFFDSLWSSILEDHTSGFLSLRFREEFYGESPYEIQEREQPWYLLYFSGWCLAYGDNDRWPKRAEDLHRTIYEEQKHLLPVLIEEQGLFDEQRRIKDFAEDISYKLDAIGRGWAALKPGDCEFCARILV